MNAADATLAVYTCITGGYDDLRPVRQPESGVRYVCFTDRPVPDAGGWEIRPLPRSDLAPAAANRYVKMHPHLVLPEHECSVYVDGNIELRHGVREFAERALALHPIALFTHPVRRCLYAEGLDCATLGLGWAWSCHAQLRRYRRDGMPSDGGLFECNILPRRHHAPEVVDLMEAWWREFTTGGIQRDQVSLPYLLWKHGTPVEVLPKSMVHTGDNPHFVLHRGHNVPSWKRTARARGNRLVPQYWLLRRGKV